MVIDPITRIEGHLRIETKVVDGSVQSAWSTGTLFRGVEPILKDRNPEDAWLFTQRLCGVCTYVHGSTSVRSVEDALNLTVPANARIIRNLLMGAQFLHDHIIHFYHLHALDWVDVVSALGADPAETRESCIKSDCPKPIQLILRPSKIVSRPLSTAVSWGRLQMLTGVMMSTY